MADQFGTFTKGDQTRIAGSARDAVRLRASGWTRQADPAVVGPATDEDSMKTDPKPTAAKTAQPRRGRPSAQAVEQPAGATDTAPQDTDPAVAA